MSRLVVMAIALTSLVGVGIAQSASAAQYNWTGFYLGLNAGYAWSNSSVESIGVPSYANPSDQPTSGSFAAGLASFGTYNFGGRNDGFIGGGQLELNWQFANLWVAGMEADIQGLAHHKNTTTETATLPIGPGLGSFINSVRSTSRSLDWLGTIRGRLGVAAAPTLLFYATGGLAYGGVKMNASAIAPNAGGVFLFRIPAVSISRKYARAGPLVPGWNGCSCRSGAPRSSICIMILAA